ncbi:MAG: ComEC/Rec2 family competence protein [Paludibacteraceae bacterium]|nr:ComEC/Rec2 family competence protein [Paludibacteraceae bacterium]
MLAALAAGVLVSLEEWMFLACAGLCVLLFITGVCCRRAREIAWGGVVLVFLFGFGAWHTNYVWQKSAWQGDTEPVIRKVQVLRTPVERAKSWQMPVRLTEGKKAMLYVQKDSTLRVPAAGDCLMVRTAITCPVPPDAYSFDYGRYLRLQGFVGSGVVPCGGLLECPQSANFSPFSFNSFFPSLRERIETLFEPFSLRERGVVESLLLGDRRRLSADTREAFAASGAMHVLAVSGLHVGCIAQLLTLLVTFFGVRKPLYHEKRRRYAHAAILSAVLIFYAFLTGLAPSVCRSVLMFTFLILGKLFRPQQSTYHNLAISAFIILAVNPLALYQPGFLLSYSAVLAIVRFEPSLRLRFRRVSDNVQNRLLRGLKKRAEGIVTFVWGLVTVSLCAQLGTLPWTIYFFHRVSNYFVLTNLGVLPLVEFLIIPTFFLYLVFARVSVAGAFFGSLLEKETWCMNEFVRWVQQLPGSSSEVYLGGLLTAILVALVICFAFRSRLRWIPAVGLTAAFVFCLWQDYRRAATEHDVVTYERSKSVAIMTRAGRSATILTNDSLYALSASYDYRLARHINHTSVILKHPQQP